MSQENQSSTLVNWIGYLGITFLLMLPISVLTVGSGAWQQGLLLYALACLGSLILLALASFLLLIPRYKEIRGAVGKRMLVALPGSILLVSLMAGRGDYPPIHDITTDTNNPPAFVALLKAREASPNGARYGAAPEWPADRLAKTQAAAYPDIQPIVSQLNPPDATTRAEQVLVEMGLEIAEIDADAGRLEATATTSWYGFKDDVVVRISEHAQGSQLDLRSMSRVGRSDVGANAARIAEFTRLFSTS